MPGREHYYHIALEWTGDRGAGTASYGGYDRTHLLSADGKPSIEASSDPAFRGDPARWNPEQLLLASLSSCHQLWYLHLCAAAGIVVKSYTDNAQGWMQEEADGSGAFNRVVLRPQVAIAPGYDIAKAEALHADAAAKCFIARSVNFPVEHKPMVRIT